MDLAVQRVVDRLASAVGRPVVLEDPALHLMAHSVHDEPVDAVRATSILSRGASPEVRRCVVATEVHRARGPVRVPADPAIGMLARVCVPVRHRGALLAFLWFVDTGDPVPASVVDRCREGADDLALLLHRDQVATPTPERVADMVRALLSGRSDTSHEAAAEIEAAHLVEPGAGVVVTAWRWDDNAALGRVLPAVLRRQDAAGVLHLARADHHVVVLAAEHARDLLGDLHERVGSELAPGRVRVGVGGPRQHLAAAPRSYDEARLALRVSRLSEHGPVATWTGLGVYRIAARLVDEGERAASVHAGLAALFGSSDTRPLLETLEAYLDAAGNAHATAAALHLHRTSVYYRLQRLEQLAGTDLKDGEERVALHLALKVGRLTAELAPQHEARPETVPAVLPAGD